MEDSDREKPWRNSEWDNVKKQQKKIFHVVLKLLVKLTIGYKYVLKQKISEL